MNAEIVVDGWPVPIASGVKLAVWIGDVSVGCIGSCHIE